MAKVERNKISSKDIERVDSKVVCATGNMLLKVFKGGVVEEKSAVSFEVSIRPGNLVIEAYFEPEADKRVPALWLSALSVELKAGEQYKIKPDYERGAVSAFYGWKSAGGIEGDAWGDGAFTVENISFDSSGRIKGSFYFDYEDQQGEQIKVVVDTFTVEGD